MAFKRALWHSGLTYKQTCRNCHSVITYKDDALDFRPWFADGFVYCPQCRTPLRHNEAYAIDRPAESQTIALGAVAAEPVETPAPQPVTEPVLQQECKSAFCSTCGKQFKDDDNFCSACGAKR